MTRPLVPLVIETASELETEQAGARLAGQLAPGAVLFLYGDLGAGKTAFVRGLARGLGANAEDVWLFLHLLFESIWRHRFLYRDLNDLLSRNRLLEVRFKQLLARKVEVATALCHGLVAAGEMHATAKEIAALAINMVVVATYWLSYDYVRTPRPQHAEGMLAGGAYQVVALAAPFLSGRSRALFERLAAAYVAA